MLQGFKQFILRGNVIDLAVGVVIGVAFQAVVQSLVKDLITPLIGIIGGQPDFSAISFTIRNSEFMIGEFLNALIAFLINAAVIYFFIVLPTNRLINLGKQGKQLLPNTKKCPYCLTDIPLKATKCAACTSTQPALKTKA